MKQLEELIVIVIYEIENELDKHQKGLRAESRPIQLKRYLSNMKILQKEVRNKRITGKRFGMSRGILDSWSFDSHLGSKIMEVEKIYESMEKV